MLLFTGLTMLDAYNNANDDAFLQMQCSVQQFHTSAMILHCGNIRISPELVLSELDCAVILEVQSFIQ